MRFNFVKILIAVIFLIVCSMLLIGGKYHLKSVNLIKKFYVKEVSLMSNSENESYNELKQSIKSKYTKEFVNLLNKTSAELKAGIQSILGDEYLLLTEQFNDIINDINEQKNIYENSAEYLSAKEKLFVIKSKIDSASDEQKNEYLDEFRACLNEISLLNTKFNNQLKGSRDKIFELKGQLKKMFKAHKNELLSLRTSEMKSCRESIKTMLKNYFLELKELNETFNIEITDNDLPFDVSSMQDCLVAGKLETECYNDIISENNQFVSENDNVFKS